MLSRRDLVGKLAAGAAGAAVAWVASGTRANATVLPGAATVPNGAGPNEAPVGALPTAAEAAVADVPPPVVVPPAPWELLRPLAQGSVVAHGWRVTDLSGPVDGACVLTLENKRGRTQRVHVCRNNGDPQGLVHTRQFDLVVMNGGQGDLGTEEGFAQAVAAISHVLAANEDAWHHKAVTTALLPHTERVRQFSAESEWTLR